MGLRSSTSGSIFDGCRGTLAWIAAGRYHGYITAPSMPHPGDTDVNGEVAFNERVTTVRDRKSQYVFVSSPVRGSLKRSPNDD